jgi:hypothetical protein
MQTIHVEVYDQCNSQASRLLPVMNILSQRTCSSFASGVFPSQDVTANARFWGVLLGRVVEPVSCQVLFSLF